MKANFKVQDHPDGETRTLYFSVRGRLITVVHYAIDREMNDEDWEELFDRDARIFLRGYNYRE